MTDLFDNPVFKKRFNALVWNSKLDESEFEVGWDAFEVDFDLKEIRWFGDMFKIRRSWVPAYFKYVPMSGLMRTTSRSESENSAFQTNTNGGTSLMIFMNAFENSMEKQRYNQGILDFKDSQKYPKLRTLLPIEENAAKHYTRTIFRQVQKEIEQSILNCHQISKENKGHIDIITVDERKTTDRDEFEAKTSEQIFEDDFQWDNLIVDREYKEFFSL